MYIIISCVVISLVGTLLHFVYEWSNHNKFVGLFAAVNESTWEHIKIALTASFLWSLVDGFKFGEYNNYFTAKAVSLLAIIIIIPLLFYTYKSILKKSYLPIDIVIFNIAIIVSQLLFNWIINLDDLNFIYNYISCIILFIIFAFYMVNTLLPRRNEIFKDPLTNKYGAKGHKCE